MKKLLFLLLLAVVGCSSTKNQKITVTGTAVNRKISAAVYSDKGVYFIDDINSWDEKYLDKQVTVTGTLTYEPDPEPENGQLMQRMSGSYYVIKKATWALKE